MNEMRSERCIMKVHLIGGFLLFMGIFSSAYALVTNPEDIIWACYLALMLIGSGILTRNSYLVISQLNILTIPVLIWNIDFWYVAFTGVSLWGVTDYFFFEGPSLISQFISLQHIYSVPLAFYALRFLRRKRRDAWKFSFMEMTLLFFLSRFFTTPARNLNCAFSNCLPIDFGRVPYPAVWFVIMFVQIYITNLLITQGKPEILNTDQGS